MNDTPDMNFYFQDRLSDFELEQLLNDNKVLIEEFESLLDRVNHENTRLYLEEEIRSIESFLNKVKAEQEERKDNESYSHLEAMR